MNTAWLDVMQQITQEAVREAAVAVAHFQTFVQWFCCVDRRCVPVCGATPCKFHGVLGGHIDSRNGVRVHQRLEHDARRAAQQGKHQLVIFEFHSDCAYARLMGLSEAQLWADAQAWCTRLYNTTLVRCTRDTATGALTFHGPRHSIEAAKFVGVNNPSAAEVLARNLVTLAGFADPAVVADLARYVLGNADYLRRSTHLFPQPFGVVVGTGIGRSATYFSVSSRCETNFQLALGVALDRVRRQGTADPEVAVVVAKNPRRHYKRSDYEAALRFLKGEVQTALHDLNGDGKLPLHTLFAYKEIGELELVEV